MIKAELVLHLAGEFSVVSREFEPSQESHRPPFTSSIRSPAGGGPLSTFPGSPPGNQRLLQATVPALVSGTASAGRSKQKRQVAFTPGRF